jgi:hypothetical protein
MEDHLPQIHEWLSDHKRGISLAACSCGWKGEPFVSSRTFWDEITERVLSEWRAHLPEPGNGPQVGVCVDADGSVHTGQAMVSVEGADYMLRALSTHLTPVALIARGFWISDGAHPDDAQDFVFPAQRVNEVQCIAWYDREQLSEVQLDEQPPGSEHLEV